MVKRIASQLEHDFLKAWFRYAPPGAPTPMPEHMGIPNRRNRFDFAFPLSKGGIAVEMEGIRASDKNSRFKSRHLTITGYSDDCEKYNLAALHGWQVFRLTQLNVKRDEDWKRWIELIARAVTAHDPASFNPRCRVNLPTYEAWVQYWNYPPPPESASKRKKAASSAESGKKTVSGKSFSSVKAAS